MPRTKQIGYYSDMYKLEFALPKFAMYKRILAKVLAERFVIDRGWSEEQAVALGTQVLRGNVETIFRWGEDLREEMPADSQFDSLPASSGRQSASEEFDFSAPVSGIAAAAITGASTDIESPHYQTPEDVNIGALGLDIASPLPSEPLREPDEKVVVPVPADEELVPAAPDEDLDLFDEGELDLAESADDAASAGGIGVGGPPSLEIVEQDLDLEMEPKGAATPLAEDAVEEFEAEELAVEPLEDNAPDTSRVTEPFPFPQSKNKPAKPNEDQWGFLGGK